MYWTFGFDAWDTTISGAIDIGDAYDENFLADLEQHIKKDTEVYGKICARFDPESEISCLNMHTGVQQTISERLMDLFIAAKKSFQETDGIFDPTILRALEHVGYDKTFSDLPKKEISFLHHEHKQILGAHNKRPLFSQVQLDKKDRSVYMPPGMYIELLGIAKGHWVDYTVQNFFSQYTSLWLSAGGDIYVRGTDETNSPWNISVQDPFDLSKDIGHFTYKNKKDFGVATSGITKRAGIGQVGKWHHIIDPRTGLPSHSDIVAATVCANSVTDADVYAKTAVILGSHQANLFFLSHPECEYVFVDVNRQIFHSPNLSFRATSASYGVGEV